MHRWNRDKTVYGDILYIGRAGITLCMGIYCIGRMDRTLYGDTLCVGRTGKTLLALMLKGVRQ